MIRFRDATEADVPAILALLTDDDLGRTRELDGLQPYIDAFRQMSREGGNTLIVGEVDGEIVATYQLTLISGLSLSAARRAQIESIRVASHLRGQGIGAALMNDAEERARAAGASLIQFTTNKIRDRAHDFYRRCGYADTHLGFKKPL